MVDDFQIALEHVLPAGAPVALCLAPLLGRSARWLLVAVGQGSCAGRRSVGDWLAPAALREPLALPGPHDLGRRALHLDRLGLILRLRWWRPTHQALADVRRRPVRLELWVWRQARRAADDRGLFWPGCSRQRRSHGVALRSDLGRPHFLATCSGVPKGLLEGRHRRNQWLLKEGGRVLAPRPGLLLPHVRHKVLHAESTPLAFEYDLPLEQAR